MLGMGLGMALCDTGRDVLAAVCGQTWRRSWNALV